MWQTCVEATTSCWHFLCYRQQGVIWNITPSSLSAWRSKATLSSQTPVFKDSFPSGYVLLEKWNQGHRHERSQPSFLPCRCVPVFTAHLWSPAEDLDTQRNSFTLTSCPVRGKRHQEVSASLCSHRRVTQNFNYQVASSILECFKLESLTSGLSCPMGFRDGKQI